MVTVPAAVSAQVWHRRSRPFTYEFTHRTPMWLVDAATPNAAFPRWLRPFATIRRRDHLSSDDRALPRKVRQVLEDRGLPWTAHRVLMLGNASSLGYVFDPLTAFFCFDADGSLEGVLAEVRNTYGGRHCYTLPATEQASTSVAKEFYVSPFLAVEGHYEIRTRLTDDEVALAISLTAPDGDTLFAASVHGRLRATTPARTVALLARNPVPSLRVSALIRWHGIRLWLRRLPVVPRPLDSPPKGTA